MVFSWMVVTLCIMKMVNSEDSMNWLQMTPAINLYDEDVPDENSMEWRHLQSGLHAWKVFKMTSNREYKTKEEEENRFHAFSANFWSMLLHNARFQKGEVSYQMGINNFSDWFPEELKALRGLRMPENFKPRPSELTAVGYLNLPLDLDWRQRNAVTEVKDQGHCGSCWAFSTTGAVESRYYLAHKEFPKPTSLSEQQLVDCSMDNNGCQGGLMENAFDYIKESGGLDSEESYPYVSGNTSEPNDVCSYKKRDVAATVAGHERVPSDERDLLLAVQKGPVSIAINANGEFLRYKSGIFFDENCDGSPQSLNHGVLLVGYGEENGTLYWLVKNSWSRHWGENGYVRIARNRGNMCGVATMASYPLI